MVLDQPYAISEVVKIFLEEHAPQIPYIGWAELTELSTTTKSYMHVNVYLLPPAGKNPVQKLVCYTLTGPGHQNHLQQKLP